VAGGETLGALAAVRALRYAGHHPWVAVHGRRAYAARSRMAAGVVTVPDPAADPDGFVRAMACAATRVPARVVLPGTEPALVAFARAADQFPAGVAIAACPPDVVERALDKTRLSGLAAGAGLVVPPTLEVGRQDLAPALGFPYPAIAKPLRSDLMGPNGSTRHYSARRVDSPKELREAVGALPNGRALVQPFLPGPIGSLAGVFWEGEMVAAVQSRGDRIWPPDCGSMTWAVTVPLDADLCSRVAALLRAVGWNGLFQLDFVDSAGTPFLIDLNPRLYTSLGITTHAGVNLPAIWVDLLLGAAPPPRRGYRVGAGYRHEEDDIRALASMFAHGNRAAALRGLLPRLGTTHAVFSHRDPMPLLTSVGKLLRLSAAALWGLVRSARARILHRAEPERRNA